MNIFKKMLNSNRVIKKENKKNDNGIGKASFIYAFLILVIIYIVFVLILLFNAKEKGGAINVSNMANDSKMNTTSNDFYVVKNIPRDDKLVHGSIFIPNTKDERLNKYIEINIDKYISDFCKLTKGKDLKLYEYTFDIFFNTYEGENGKYIAFVFYISMDTGLAHPNSYIWSVVYDIKKKEIINIESLVKKYSNFLVNISEFSYNILSQDAKIKSSGAIDMLKKGTRPTKENFRNFVIDKDKLIIFFEKYQVAPYVLGEFKVEIPVKDILK